MEKSILVYTDGSSGAKGGMDGGIGAVLVYGSSLRVVQKAYSNTTNNRMEIRAVIEALKIIANPKLPVFVYSDSQYVVNAFNKRWIKSWQERCFVDVKNEDLWRELIKITRQFSNLTFTWVKGHADNEINNLCDELARNAKELGTKKIPDLP